MSIILKNADELRPQVECILGHLSTRIKILAPDAEFHHIGATAIPGALTKGDLDVLLRVSPDRFPAIVESLKQQFQMKQTANWTPAFASFGDDSGHDLPVGVQVAVKDSAADFLLFLRDHLIEHPNALAEYNRLKMANAERGPEGYWKAKDEFLSRILAGRKKS